MSIYGSPSDELFIAVGNITNTPLTNDECADIIRELREMGYEIRKVDSPQEGCAVCHDKRWVSRNTKRGVENYPCHACGTPAEQDTQKGEK